MPKGRVHITGPNMLQNELLKIFLEKESALACSTGEDFSLAKEKQESPEVPSLVLFDCLYNDFQRLWADMEAQPEAAEPEVYVALFNAPADPDFTREAMARKVRGIFYDHSEPDALKKGVAMILEGELWYSRESLSHFLLEPKSPSTIPEKIAETLTPREKEILKKIAAGASNQEIADTLYISLHTVKSHIYNVYKKINVPNRLQAALWVAKYL